MKRTFWAFFLLAGLFAAQAQFVFTTNNDSITITAYTSLSLNAVIPATTNGYPVTAISATAFTSSSLTNVFIPYTVTNVGNNPFGNNLGLTSFSIDAQNPLWSSIDGVWFDKSQTMLIKFPAAKSGYTIPGTVTSIGNYAFKLCQNITNIVIPTSVTSMGSNAFNLCKITTIVIPSSITNIASYAFFQCYQLASINIPDSVTSIGYGAFQDCHALTNVSLPNTITSLPGNLFATCTSLTSLTIPGSVTNVGDNAFWGTALQSVYFQGHAPSYNNAFYMGGSTPLIYYLPGTTNWGATWGAYYSGRPTRLWNPQAQTADGRFGIQNNQFGFNITGTPDIPVMIEAATNLNSTWVPLQSVYITNGSLYFSDPQWTSQPSRYYRLRSP